jgi:hypothetical protein
MVAIQLTADDIGTLSDKLDDLAILFTGSELSDKRKALYIDTLRSSTMPGMIPKDFNHLCVALDRTRQRWERPGQMPTPHFILETISTRGD